MRVHIALLFLIVSLFSCSSQDDYDYNCSVKNSSYNETRSGEDDFFEMDFRLCVTYHPSIISYNGFVYFSKIFLYDWSSYMADSNNPILVGRYDVGLYDQVQCPIGNVNFDKDFYIKILRKDKIIANELWDLSIDIHVAPYFNDGDYGIILYNAYQEDMLEEIGRAECRFAQAGDVIKMSHMDLPAVINDQTDYYLQLYVYPL